MKDQLFSVVPAAAGLCLKGHAVSVSHRRRIESFVSRGLDVSVMVPDVDAFVTSVLDHLLSLDPKIHYMQVTK